MRLALVSEHASPLAALGGADAGGQNVHVAALAAELAKAGHEVLVSTRRDDPGLAELVDVAAGVQIHHVEAGPPEPIGKDALLTVMPAFADRLAAMWRRWRPDVVHAHFWMSGIAALEAARGHDLPVAQTFHALGTVKRRHQGLADTSPRTRLVEERRVALSADRIVATCTDEVAELARMGVPGDRSVVVPCGVDLTTFRPDGPAAARDGARHRLLTVGRLVPRKGVDDTIRALTLLPATELLIAGGPPDGALVTDPEVARLRALATSLGVTDRVRFLGAVARAEVPALMRSSDLVVASPWYEPFGIVPLEAMACGVPVVVADVGGMRDTVLHARTGLRVPPRSPDVLAAAIGRLLDDPRLREDMGTAGVHRVRQRYSWSRVAATTAQVYADMIAARAQRSVG